jgi:hypothetical protein
MTWCIKNPVPPEVSYEEHTGGGNRRFGLQPPHSVFEVCRCIAGHNENHIRIMLLVPYQPVDGLAGSKRSPESTRGGRREARYLSTATYVARCRGAQSRVPVRIRPGRTFARIPYLVAEMTKQISSHSYTRAICEAGSAMSASCVSIYTRSPATCLK